MRIRAIATIVTLLIAVVAMAQPKINSPLSRLGIGNRHFHNAYHLNLMGGLYGAFADEEIPNTYNPAGIGFLKSTAFDLGVTAGYSEIELGSESDQYNHGNLEHISLAFPLRNSIGEVLERKSSEDGWSMGFDLHNRTRIGYSVSLTDSTAELGEVARTYEGTGGTYELGWVNAYRYKNLSFGLDIGLFFGNVTENRTVVFNDFVDAVRDFYEDEISIRGFRWKLGAQYRYLLNKKEENEGRKRYLTMGAYGHLGQGFNTTGTQIYHGVRVVSGIRDTLLNDEGIEGDGRMPGLFGFGLTYEPDLKWQLGFNVELSNWNNFESDDFSAGGFGTAVTLGAGFSFIPDRNAFGRYFKRVAYKGGFQYIQDGRVFNGDEVRILKANAGMTMPFYYLRQISHVHLGIEYKRTTADILNENYFGVILSATFNDNSWFLKRKFN